MTVDNYFLCEACGGEFPVSEMDGGPDGKGTFCLDCGCEACGEAMDAAELAGLMARMPSWEEFLAACGITTSERLVGNCHWAATVLRDLLRTRGVPCRLRRGFWHGTIAAKAGRVAPSSSTRGSRPGRAGSSLPWTRRSGFSPAPSLESRLARTTFAMTGRGGWLKRQRRGLPATMRRRIREGDLSPSKLSDEAREALSLLAGRDWSVSDAGRALLGRPSPSESNGPGPPGRFRRQSGRQAGRR